MNRVATALVLAAALGWSLPAAAGFVAPTGYAYLSGGGGSYADSTYSATGGELTDGVTHSIAWDAGVSIGYPDVAGLVGWENNDPSVRFTFAPGSRVQSVTVWAADSNNHAGVGLPSSVTLSAPGFAPHTVAIDPLDYPGGGATVPLVINGFDWTVSELTVTAARAHAWTMFSEVQFADIAAVPEPTGAIAVLAAAIAAGASRRR